MQMHQPSGPRSGASTLFRPQALEGIPQTFAWFEEMRTRHPVFYDEVMPMPLWQVTAGQLPATVGKDQAVGAMILY